MITALKIDQSDDITIKTETDDGNKHCIADSRKFAIIHVVSSTQTVAMAPPRKLTVIKKSVPSDKIITKDKRIHPPISVKEDVYHQRKRMLLEYKDLFAALMRLPDKQLQKKLLDVINNHQSTEYKTVGTQTDNEFKVCPTYHDKNKTYSVSNDVHSNGSETGSLNIKNSNTSEEIVKKRKRKRKVSLPQANKESRTKQLAKMNKPKAANRNNISMSDFKSEPKTPSKRQRIDSFCLSDCSSDVVNIFEDTQTNHAREIAQCSYPLENGLLPIQDAVIRNQTNKLHIHMHIWQSHKGIDLNDILTEEDEDLLQLAVLNTCDPSIVSLLLHKGLNPNTLDADSNTVVHLAILNDIAVASLDYLMQRIDLKLLLTLNDDGYTPLHLAIRQDRYLLAECLINVMDKCLSKSVFYKRPLDELETDEIVLKTQFKNYYENVCLQLTVDEETDSCTVNNHDLKQKLLQSEDRRSGNTALYFAIDNRFEHLIYFLLAHLTDPRTENLSGLDCKTYFCEFGKSLNLSLNIDTTMEKVIKLLS